MEREGSSEPPKAQDTLAAFNSYSLNKQFVPHENLRLETSLTFSALGKI